MVCSAEWRSHSASSLILMSTYIWKPRCIDHVTPRDMISNWPCMAMLLVLHACDVSRTACILRGTWRGASSHWRWHSASIEGAAWAGKQNKTRGDLKGSRSLWRRGRRQMAPIPECSSSCCLCWASPPPSLRRTLRLGRTSCSPERVCMKTSTPEQRKMIDVD